MTWTTVRHNNFTDPRARTLGVSWGCYSTHTLSEVTDPDGTTWIRSTRIGGGDGRAIEMRCGRMQVGEQNRLRVHVRASVQIDPVKVSIRADVNNSSTGVDLATLIVPAGESDITVSGAFTAGKVNPAFVMNTVFDPVGTTFDFRAVLIEPEPAGEYFDGSTPGTETRRYIWEDRPDASVSLGQDYTYVDPNPDGGPKYAPVVKVLGQTIPCDFDTTGLNPVVLDGIEVTWGRDALYDATNPSELRFAMFDPTGALASDPGLFGAAITVETPLGVLFRGQVDGVSIEPDTINDPNPSVPESVWRVTVSATDVIATLAKMVAPGYETTAEDWNERLRKEYGVGFWEQGDSEYRRRQVEGRWKERGVNTRLITRDFATMVPPGAAPSWQSYYREAHTPSGDDLYSLAQSVIHRGDRPFYVNYDARDDTLEAGLWPPAVPLTLYDAAGRMQIGARAVTGADDVIVIDCTLVELVEPGAVESSVTHNIASLRVTELWGFQETIENGAYTIDKYQAATIDYPVQTPGGGTAQYQPPIKPAVPNGDANTDPQNATEYAALIAPYVEAVNGRMVPPDFIFDIEAQDFGSQVEEEILTTWGSKAAWAFPGSRYDALTGFGPVFQRIGGELIYNQGWRVRSRFAPSPVYDASTLTLEELVTDEDRTLSDFAQNVMLVHLAGVTGSTV